MRTLPLQVVAPAIRGLDLNSLSRQLEAFNAGYLAQFAQTAQLMEERDELLRNVISKRKKAVSRLPWEVVACDASNEAREHQQALHDFYLNLTCTHALSEEMRGGFSLLVFQMLDALAKGWSVHEITWTPYHAEMGNTHADSWPAQASAKRPAGPIRLTATLRFFPLWYFQHVGTRLRYAPVSPFKSEEMTEREWLVTATQPLMPACARAFLYKHIPLQAWLDYCQKYGMPAVRGVTSAARGSADWDAFSRTVERLVSELSLVTNNTETVEIVDLQGKGQPPFGELVERMDRMMAAIWRGADLSTLSRDQGYGASLQAEESDVLETDDAEMISTTLNSTLDRWAIQYLFGDHVIPRACVKLLPRAREQTEQNLAVDRFLLEHGARLSLADTLARYGRTEARADEPALERNSARVEQR